MGRKKLAEKMLEEIEGEDEDGRYLIVYDFEGGRNPKAFYRNLEALRGKEYYIGRLQKSVLMTDSRKCALAIKELAMHYGAEVHVFKVTEVL